MISILDGKLDTLKFDNWLKRKKLPNGQPLLRALLIFIIKIYKSKLGQAQAVHHCNDRTLSQYQIAYSSSTQPLVNT